MHTYACWCHRCMKAQNVCCFRTLASVATCWPSAASVRAAIPSALRLTASRSEKLTSLMLISCDLLRTSSQVHPGCEHRLAPSSVSEHVNRLQPTVVLGSCRGRWRVVEGGRGTTFSLSGYGEGQMFMFFFYQSVCAHPLLHFFSPPTYEINYIARMIYGDKVLKSAVYIVAFYEVLYSVFYFVFLEGEATKFFTVKVCSCSRHRLIVVSPRSQSLASVG